MLVVSHIMRCTNCGAEIRASARTCDKCGRPVARIARAKTMTSSAPPARTPAPDPPAQKPVKRSHTDVAKKVKFDYMYGSKGNLDKALAGMDSVF